MATGILRQGRHRFAGVAVDSSDSTPTRIAPSPALSCWMPIRKQLCSIRMLHMCIFG